MSTNTNKSNICANLCAKVRYIEYLWNLTRIFNSTPLILAAGKGHSEIVETLISQENIEINCKDI